MKPKCPKCGHPLDPAKAEAPGLCTWAKVTMRCVCHRGETKYLTCAQRSVDFLPPFCPDCARRVELVSEGWLVRPSDFAAGAHGCSVHRYGINPAFTPKESV